MLSIFKEIKTYLETRYNIARLDISEKIIIVISLVIQVIIIVLLSCVILVVFSFALANYLGKYWDNTGLGFLTVTGLNILLLLIFIIFRKAFIIKPLSKILIQLLLNRQKDEEDEENDI